MTTGRATIRTRPVGSRPSSPGAATTVRAERARAALVAAARTVFEEDGYLDTNVGDIAHRAKVDHGTFYAFFNSKEEIFAEVVDALLADLRRIADDEPPVADRGSVAARIERANRGFLRGYQANARMMAVLEQVATFNPRLAEMRRSARRHWVERGTAALRRWQDAGLVDASIDPDYAANALGSMVDRSAYIWLVLGEPYDFETAVSQLTILYCNAIGVPYEPGGG